LRLRGGGCPAGERVDGRLDARGHRSFGADLVAETYTLDLRPRAAAHRAD